jgi:DNA-binding beta-propeller fold protein YncE
MTSDPVERLLGGIDRPVTPRPEFAEALLDRLLVELESEADRQRDPGEQNQEDPMITASASLPAISALPFPGPRMSVAARPATPTRRNRVLSYLATAALLLLTLAAGYLAVGPHRGDMGDDSSIRLAAVSTPIADSTPGPEAPVAFVWQTTGGPSQPLSGAGLLAIDPQGNLWVPDAQAHQFQVFTPDGTFVEAWGTPGSGDGELNLIASGYSYGAAAFDADGNLYVADTGNHRIQKFGPDRNFITAWGSQGAEDGQFLRPLTVAVDGRGRVFVGDDLRSDVQVFDSDGGYLATWGGKDAREGRLNGPSGITFDEEGNVWVADFNSNRVLQFSPEGEFLTAWGEYGSNEGELFEPQSLAVDAQGRVYVTEFGNYRVQVFDGEGKILAAWGESGRGEGQFDGIYGIVLDDAGHVYVSELLGKRVQKFRLLPPLAP